MKNYARVSERTDARMSELNVSIDTSKGLAAVEKLARHAAARQGGNTMLVAWWDGNRKLAGPLESCCGETAKCSRDYAASHGASTHVSVNDGQLEFFYGSTEGHAELTREGVLKAHYGLENVELHDVAGG